MGTAVGGWREGVAGARSLVLGSGTLSDKIPGMDPSQVLREDSGNVPSQVPSRRPSDGPSQIPNEDISEAPSEDHSPLPSHRHLVPAWLCRHLCQRTTMKGRQLHVIRMMSSA